MTTKELKELQSHQIAVLTNLFKDGDILYGITHRTNANSDIVQVLFIHNGRIEDLTRRIAKACQLRLAKHGIRVNGWGFSKAMARRYWTLAYAMLEAILENAANMEKVNANAAQVQ